jgi:MoxR-like ATPase
MTTLAPTETQLLDRIEEIGAKIEAVREATGSVIFGQSRVIDLALITVLSGGHALLIGVPGLAKTSLVETLGAVLGLENKRIQFTPDLMPSDIVGSEVLEQATDGKRGFRFVKGPVFTQLLMADEINRASPKTQSALLQAMQEHHVTVAGVRHDVPRPFHVLATQNPLEQEGTYPLPEAQLDRFLLQIDVSYPDEAAERRMLFATTGVEDHALKTILTATRRKGKRRTRADDRNLKTILTADELMMAQILVRQLPVGDQVVDAILKLVRSARPGTGIDQELEDLIAWGPGPRASQALMLAVRAKAMMEGRLAPSVDDVIELAEPVLKHRMALTFAARAEGLQMSDLVARLVKPLG